MPMKWFFRKATLLVFVILICCCFFTAQATAALISLSNVSSDETPADWLDAQVVFAFNPSTSFVTLSVTNLTGADTTPRGDPSYFNISAIYFNATSNVGEVFFASLGDWELFARDDPDAKGNPTKADGFGIFDYALIADKQGASNSDLINPGETVDFTFFILGGSPSDTDFTTEYTTDQNGNEIALAAAKFVNGPDWNPIDDSAFGANAVPEPATMLLLGVGLIGMAGLGRKMFGKSDQS
jgi:hypothetical protein